MYVNNVFAITDYLTLPGKYFWCGHTNYRYYNPYFYKAVRLIGKHYGDKKILNSDDYKGVKYISEKLHLSKTEIKILRKNLIIIGARGIGYEFKVPYKVAEIVQFMIIQLKAIKNIDKRRYFNVTINGVKYRDIIIPEQYNHIRVAGTLGDNEEILKIIGELNSLIETIK